MRPRPQQPQGQPRHRLTRIGNDYLHNPLALTPEQRQTLQPQGQGSHAQDRYTKGPCKRHGKGCSTGPRRQTPGGRTGNPSSRFGRVRAIGGRVGAVAGIALLAPHARKILYAVKEAKDNPDLPGVVRGLAAIVSDFDDALGQAQRAISGPPVPGVAESELQLWVICSFKGTLTKEDSRRSRANKACYERQNPPKQEEVIDTPDSMETRREEINELLNQCQAFEEQNQQVKNSCDGLVKELQGLNWVTDADKVIPNSLWSGGCRCREDKPDCPLSSLHDCTKGWPRTEEERQAAENAEEEEKAYWAQVVAGLGLGPASKASKAEGKEPNESPTAGVPGPPKPRPTEPAIAGEGPPGLPNGPTFEFSDEEDLDDNVQSIAWGKNKHGFCELDTGDVYDPATGKYLVEGTNKFISKPNRWEPENVDTKCA